MQGEWSKNDRVCMKKQWKFGLYLLVVCAGCLLLGKCLRIFSDKTGDTKTNISQETQNLTPTPSLEKGSVLLTDEQQEQIADFEAGGRSVVLDAGHGGIDPGKVGVNGANEKDINLSIVEKLKGYLEEVGFTVTLTRTSDDGLYSNSDSNKKSADMKARIKVMEEAKPDFSVSIHQNSFTQESSFGAQVFYFESSAEGKRMAEQLQTTLKQVLADDNRREAKSNTSYYLLKKSPCPMVIVECGFLSNKREAELLITEEYQDKLAWAVCLGVVEYCRQGVRDGIGQPKAEKNFDTMAEK